MGFCRYAELRDKLAEEGIDPANALGALLHALWDDHHANASDQHLTALQAVQWALYRQQRTHEASYATLTSPRRPSSEGFVQGMASGQMADWLAVVYGIVGDILKQSPDEEAEAA
jgi:hypothetical protein